MHSMILPAWVLCALLTFVSASCGQEQTLEHVSEETASEETATEETTTEDASSEDTTAEDTTAEDTTAEDTTAEDTATEDTDPANDSTDTPQDDTPASSCAADAVEHAGYCWYASANQESCAQACASRALLYDPEGTENYAGMDDGYCGSGDCCNPPDGDSWDEPATEANPWGGIYTRARHCFSVLNELFPGQPMGESWHVNAGRTNTICMTQPPSGIGCFYTPNHWQAGLHHDTPTTADAVDPGHSPSYRACACR